MRVKICGVRDKNTLEFIVCHPNPPEFIGFICNYKKSKRFVDTNSLKNLLQIKKKKSKYVAVLVNPTEVELAEISRLPFDYYQIYDMSLEKVKKIRNNYMVKIIMAITVENKIDVFTYKKYLDVADILLFDGKGYEKSIAFDHNLIKNIKSNLDIMIAGNIQINDNLDKYNKIADIIDISGGLETSGLKDISKINFFLNKIKKVNNET